MPHHVVVISGQVCSGKTTLAEQLAYRFAFEHIKTRQCILALRPETEVERRALQAAGDQLDSESGGSWVRNAIETHLGNHNLDVDSADVVLDAVRVEAQIDSLRQGYGNRVLHVHLEAPREVLEARYATRDGEVAELSSYTAVMDNETEKSVQSLADAADVVISTARCTQEDVLLRVAGHLGLFGRSFDRIVDVLVGGQYGSEGKGQIAAYLAPEYELLVRVGGPNAGHKVWEAEKPYTYHQLPSGTRRNSSAQIAIGAGAVINPKVLLKEIAECKLDAERLSIDPQAAIICDQDVQAETALEAKIGSTKQGVGHATARRITDRQQPEPHSVLAKHCKELEPFVRPVGELLDKFYGQRAPIMLEGTQGTGLSLYHGSYPHVTSRDTTVAGCLADSGISPSRVRKVVMVCRTYPIRVESPAGETSGPMSNEISWEVVAERAGLNPQELQSVERTSTTDKPRRVGEFDWAQLRRSASLNAPTDIALTFVDYLCNRNSKAFRVDQLDRSSLEFIEEVERIASAPVSLMSVRFHSRAIIDRRRW